MADSDFEVVGPDTSKMKGGKPTGGEVRRPNFWERTAIGAGDVAQRLGAGPGMKEGIYDLMPHDWTEAVTTGLSMALPEAKGIGKGLEAILPGAERVGAAIGKRGAAAGLARLATTAGAGAGTAALTGEETPTAGALQGAGTYAAAAIPSKIADMLNRWHMGSRLLKTDPQGVGRIINQMVPEFPKLKTPIDFRNAFISTGAQRAASDEFTNGIRALNNMPGLLGKKLHVPEFSNTVSDLIKKPVPVDLTMRQVGDLWPKAMEVSGYGRGGEPIHSASGVRVRASHEQMADEIRNEIGKWNNRAPAAFDQVRRRYSRASRIRDVLNTPGVIDKNGDLNMQKVQAEWAQSDKSKRLEGGRPAAFDPAEVAKFWDRTFRGGKLGKQDVPPVPLNMRTLWHGIKQGPRMYTHLPHPGLYAGDPRSALAAILQNMGRGAGAGAVNYGMRPEDEPTSGTEGP